MRVRIVVLSLAACAAAATFAVAQQPNVSARAEAPRAQGYLPPDMVPQVGRILPPPPPEGSERQKQDFDVYRNTRQLMGSSRWRLAQADNSYTVPYLLSAFSCSAGVQLTPQNAPKTATLVGRMLRDTGATSAAAKDVFTRKRPYLYVDGPICIDKTPGLATSPDYPSGHATLGYGVALVLAELMPDRATQLLTRGRAYGESRVVCGVHTVSAAQAGWTTASAAVATLHGSPDFRADLEAARAEIEELRETSDVHEGDSCLVENTLTARSPY